MEKEITTYDKDRFHQLVELLMDCGYVCMTSREEGLYVINYIQSLGTYKCDNEDNQPDRNDVVFMSKDEYEELIFERKDNE